jgi:hypothetical protein
MVTSPLSSQPSAQTKRASRNSIGAQGVYQERKIK